jgi:hypothetical protein
MSFLDPASQDIEDTTRLDSRVQFVPDSGSAGKLVIERLAIPDTAAQELWPLGHVRDRVRGLGQEAPEFWMVPAEIMAAAVPVLPDSFP